MVQVNIVITEKGDQVDIQCNLLSREDATKFEWIIAKSFEEVTSNHIKTTTDNKSEFTIIDGPVKP